MAALNSGSSRIPKKTVKDFKFIKEIGKGSYSTVRGRKICKIFNFSNMIQVFLAIETATNREIACRYTYILKEFV